MCISKCCLNVLSCQFGIRGEYVAEVRSVREVRDDSLYRDAGAGDDRLPVMMAGLSVIRSNQIADLWTVVSLPHGGIGTEQTSVP
jgi:hypothetical protein